MRRLLAWRSPGRDRGETRDALRDRLLAVMEQPGCPVCALAREQESRYFFWFFAENYHAPETLEQLVAARGFCRLHAGRLAVRAEANAAALAVVYELVSRKVVGDLVGAARRDAPARPLAPPGTCPACQSRQRTERRFLEALADLLGDGRSAARYRPPQLLCHAHLRALEPLLGRDALQRVLELHRGWLAGAVRAVDEGEEDVSRLAALVADVDAADLVPAHHASEDPEDLERAVTNALDDEERCPACTAERHAYRAWARYCGAHAANGEPIDDLLPTCDLHATAFLVHGSAPLRASILRNLAARVHDVLGRSLECLEKAPAGRRRRPRLADLASVRGEPPEVRARRHLRRDIPCPVCSMLATTQARALELVGVLASSGPAAERYERGHGLCLRHLQAAVQPPIDGAASRALLRHARRDVALLAWRLHEEGRLSAWNARPLPPAANGEAWRRALYRYAGVLL